jgi:site-specific DNA recombinase
MKKYFSYIRVSTVRQGSGTSLVEQREAIERYASRWNLKIVEEFEEKETAAKLGRPVFSHMLKSLKQGKADGLIIHKIDRSARNLRDWAEVGELIDQGAEIHFANENLDLYTRGGRLSADIQAVVAADYIRNLREEVKKGFYGRIKQGLYPMPAPAGYVDKGQGQPKEVDPVQGKLVKMAFELYSTGNWSVRRLIRETYDMGLRNRNGGKLSISGMCGLLRNPFYLGLICIKRTGEMFSGSHVPLISKSLFDKVQTLLNNKAVVRQTVHRFLFNKLLTCEECQYKRIAELQKGIIYYRCHTPDCSQKNIREDVVEAQFLVLLKDLMFGEKEKLFFRQQIQESYRTNEEFRKTRIQALMLQQERLTTRLSILTDTFLDQLIEKEVYVEKKNSLTLEAKTIKEQLEHLNENETKAIKKVEDFLELVNNAYLSYQSATPEEKREMVTIVTSNFFIKDKSVLFKLNYPFEVLLNCESVSDGGAYRYTPRTVSSILSQLYEYFCEYELDLK